MLYRIQHSVHQPLQIDTSKIINYYTFFSRSIFCTLKRNKYRHSIYYHYITTLHLKKRIDFDNLLLNLKWITNDNRFDPPSYVYCSKRQKAACVFE